MRRLASPSRRRSSLRFQRNAASGSSASVWYQWTATEAAIVTVDYAESAGRTVAASQPTAKPFDPAASDPKAIELADKLAMLAPGELSETALL